MDRVDRTPKLVAEVDSGGDTIRVSNPNRKGTFVSFEVRGLTDEARVQLSKIEHPTRADVRAAGISMHLLSDPETSDLANKNRFEIRNEHIKTNLDVSDSLYKRMRQVALDAFIAWRKKQ